MKWTKRRNISIMEMTRNKLKGKNPPNKFWVEAVYTVIIFWTSLQQKLLLTRHHMKYGTKEKRKLTSSRCLVAFICSQANTNQKRNVRWKRRKIHFICYSDDEKPTDYMLLILTSWWFLEKLFSMNYNIKLAGGSSLNAKYHWRRK